MVKKIAIICVIIVTLYFSIMLILKNVFYPKKYKEYVDKYSALYSVDPDLVYSVIKQESNFNDESMSSKGAEGLMQLMPTTAREVSQDINSVNENEFDLKDKETNVNIGVKYLSYLIERYNGNMYIALAAYNAGLGNVDKWFKEDILSYDSYEKILKNIKFNETKRYVSNVIKYYNMYKKLY